MERLFLEVRHWVEAKVRAVEAVLAGLASSPNRMRSLVEALEVDMALEKAIDISRQSVHTASSALKKTSSVTSHIRP